MMIGFEVVLAVVCVLLLALGPYRFAGAAGRDAGSGNAAAARSNPDLAEIDAFAELGRDGLRRPAGGGDLDLVAARSPRAGGRT